MTLVTQSPAEISHGIDNILRDVLSQFPDLELAILFGSVACDRARIDSDLDIAVSGKKPLGVDEHVQIISALAPNPFWGILKHGFAKDCFRLRTSRKLFAQSDQTRTLG